MNPLSHRPFSVAGPSNGYVWYVVWLLFAVNMLNYVDRMILAVLIEDIRRDIPMTDTQIGIVTGLAFAAFYAAAGIFLGRLADLYSRRMLMGVAITGWSIATAACGMAASFWHLLVARLFVGFGEASSMPASQSLIADYCGIERRAAAYAILAAGGSVGLTVGLAGGGWLAGQVGWRTAFVVAGALGLPFALLLWWTLKDPVRGAQDRGAATREGLPFSDVLAALIRNRTFLYIVLSSTCTGFVLYGVAQWMPAYLIRRFGLSTAEVGLYFGLAMGVGAAVGAIVGGFLTNRLVARGVHWLLTLPLLVNLLIVPAYWGLLSSPSLSFTIAGLFLINIVGALGFGSAIAGLHSVVPAGMRASASAVYGLFTSLLGVGLAPFLIGVLSDHFHAAAGPGEALRLALMIATTVGWGTPFFLWLARRNFNEALVHSESNE
ncbi:MAG: MFS transporter [Sphingopyxis sp.]|uniref:spinster family MFS transporter n=1 Tax=Sphingopyxis sp. TaxID=1908224 RepID=UPI002AB94447|nr:MFS transporter [Sphingopyxis sp.]MDZ3833531.1 MFS transporter [Sphingopyxis sp.]